MADYIHPPGVPQSQTPRSIHCNVNTVVNTVSLVTCHQGWICQGVGGFDPLGQMVDRPTKRKQIMGLTPRGPQSLNNSAACYSYRLALSLSIANKVAVTMLSAPHSP